MATPAVRIYDTLKLTLGEESSKKFIEALDENTVSKIEIMIKDLATKTELNAAVRELTKTIYIVGLAQFLAIVASVIAIIKN
jgi:hypothetical protein